MVQKLLHVSLTDSQAGDICANKASIQRLESV